MKLQNSITVVAALLSVFFLAGAACAHKSDVAADPAGTDELVASTVPFVSLAESDAVEEAGLAEEPAVAAEAEIVDKPEAKVELMAQADKDKTKSGKATELDEFAPQAGLSFHFNRLLKKKLAKNLPPVEDGIHDPENPAGILLQTPKDGMKGYVKSSFGNRVDWVKTLNQKIINPRASLEDPTEEMDILELNVVRVPVGSMPKVVYPHDRHTAWLACENCHEEIFIPEAGANDISMEMIIRGEKCGVCHGKVAFPVSQCKKCHSLRKTKEEKAAQGIR